MPASLTNETFFFPKTMKWAEVAGQADRHCVLKVSLYQLREKEMRWGRGRRKNENIPSDVAEIKMH